MATLVEGRDYTTLKKQILRTVDGRLQVDVVSSDTADDTILNDIKTNTTQEAGAYSFSKALPVLLTTYAGGSSLNVVGSQGQNMKVYIDDANPDFVANSGMATGAKQDDIKTAIEGTLTTDNLEGFSTTTLFSSQSVSASSNATSSSVDTSGYRMVNILGNDTETSFVNNLEMEVSTDNTTFYKWSNFSHSPDANSGDFGFQIAGLGVRYVRFKYVNNDSISHTISAVLSLRKN